ncbi:MAG: PA3496 family putative envelope integrity protein, partial [Shewanella sp.]
MAHITEVVPNDTEIEAMTTPRNSKAAEAMQHKREIKKRLEDYLERAELRRALGD